MWKTYIEYIKDNPKGLWFKNKLYGFGWTPATWQGWLVLVLYIVAFIYFFLKIDRNSHSVSDTLIGFAVPFIILSATLIAICYIKGERPHWQWGIKKSNE